MLEMWELLLTALKDTDFNPKEQLNPLTMSLS